jgi:hypothetical protein
VPFFDLFVESSSCFAKNKRKYKILSLAGRGEEPMPFFHVVVESFFKN